MLRYCGAHRFGYLDRLANPVTAKVDLPAVIDEARTVDLKGVFLGLGRPLNGVERIESRMVPMGRWPATDLLC